MPGFCKPRVRLTSQGGGFVRLRIFFNSSSELSTGDWYTVSVKELRLPDADLIVPKVTISMQTGHFGTRVAYAGLKSGVC